MSSSVYSAVVRLSLHSECLFHALMGVRASPGSGDHEIGKYVFFHVSKDFSQKIVQNWFIHTSGPLLGGWFRNVAAVVVDGSCDVSLTDFYTFMCYCYFYSKTMYQ